MCYRAAAEMCRRWSDRCIALCLLNIFGLDELKMHASHLKFRKWEWWNHTSSEWLATLLHGSFAIHFWNIMVNIDFSKPCKRTHHARWNLSNSMGCVNMFMLAMNASKRLCIYILLLNLIYFGIVINRLKTSLSVYLDEVIYIQIYGQREKKMSWWLANEAISQLWNFLFIILYLRRLIAVCVQYSQWTQRK